MTPLISYYGGKQRLAARLLPLLPPHTVYAEPFAGGLAVLYAKGRPPITNTDHYREAVNDTNGVLVTLYRVAKLQPDALIRQLEATPYSKRRHDEAKAICREPAGHDDVTVAWAAYVNSMMSFSNTWGAGWSRRVFSRNGAATWAGKLDTLHERMARLRDVAIDDVDAPDFIQLWDSPHTVFYCDPPYPNTDQGHYAGYTLDDFAALVDALSTCRASFVLSNYHQDIAIPGDWQRHELTARMSAANSRNGRRNTHRTEVVWVKDRSANTRPDLRPLLWQPGKPRGVDIAKQNGHIKQGALL